MDDILRAKAKIDGPAGGQDEDRGDDVILAVRIGGIEAQRVAVGRADQRRPDPAIRLIGSGIAKIPLELNARDFHLDGMLSRASLAAGRPELVAGEVHGDIEAGDGEKNEHLAGEERLTGTVPGFPGGLRGRGSQAPEKRRDQQHLRGHEQPEHRWRDSSAAGGRA